MMHLIFPFLLSAVLIAAVVWIMLWHRKKGDVKSEYLYRKDRGVYYFDNGKLVLNVPYPYRPRAVALEEIDHLIFIYDIYSMEMGKYTVGIDIVKKDGTTVTGPGFVISMPVNPFDPKEAAQDLEAHGIRCELPSGKGSILGNRPK